jgi:putative flavoprotein involved in K+ transport
MIEKIDTVVVGGGQAGLAMSYHLKQSGREHVILERVARRKAGGASAGTR